MAWFLCFGLLALAIVRRHGWEYVPLVMALVAGRWYVAAHQSGMLGDGLVLASMAAVWVVTGITRDDDSPSRRSG